MLPFKLRKVLRAHIGESTKLACRKWAFQTARPGSGLEAGPPSWTGGLLRAPCPGPGCGPSPLCAASEKLPGSLENLFTFTGKN